MTLKTMLTINSISTTQYSEIAWDPVLLDSRQYDVVLGQRAIMNVSYIYCGKLSQHGCIKI